MDSNFLTFLLVYLSLSHVIARYVGQNRKMGYANAFTWSIILTPPFALAFILLTSPKLDPQESNG